MNGLYNVRIQCTYTSQCPTPAFSCWIGREADQIGVGEADWAFKTTFNVSKEQLAEPHADLLFEGLDTFCDISLVSPPPLDRAVT